MTAPDTREAAILQALFGGESIPFAVMDVLAEIRAHISAIIALCDHQPMPLRSGQMLNRDPAQSQALNLRIAQLWETPKADGRRRTWPEVAAEVGSGMVASSARNRYQRYQAQLAEKIKREGYEALQGLAEHTSPHAGEIVFSAAVVPVRTGLEHEQDMDALKAKIIQLRAKGMDVKAIAEQLGIKWQWVRGVLARASRAPGVRMENDAVAPNQPAQENVALVHEDTKKAHEPKSISRAELDAKIWRYWDHGKGKTPAEISDLLCAEGYYHGEKSVRTRLLQQGAKL